MASWTAVGNRSAWEPNSSGIYAVPRRWGRWYWHREIGCYHVWLALRYCLCTTIILWWLVVTSKPGLKLPISHIGKFQQKSVTINDNWPDLAIVAKGPDINSCIVGIDSHTNLIHVRHHIVFMVTCVGMDNIWITCVRIREPSVIYKSLYVFGLKKNNCGYGENSCTLFQPLWLILIYIYIDKVYPDKRGATVLQLICLLKACYIPTWQLQNVWVTSSCWMVSSRRTCAMRSMAWSSNQDQTWVHMYWWRKVMLPWQPWWQQLKMEVWVIRPIRWCILNVIFLFHVDVVLHKMTGSHFTVTLLGSY